MGILSDNYKNHSIHQEIETTLKYMENYKQTENLSDVNNDSLEAYEQLLIYTKYVLDNCITQVLPTQLLSNLQENIKKLRSAPITNIESTYNTYSNITSDLAKIPVYKDKNTVRLSVGKIIENFNLEKENIKQSINTEIEQFNDKQNIEFEKWKEEKEDYTKQLKDLKDENNLLKEEMKKITQNIKNEQERLDTIIANFNSDYNEKSDAFKKEFEDTQQKNKDATDVLLKYMMDKQNDVEKLWGIIGKASVSGSSQSYANRAKAFAHWMTFLALSIMGFAIWSLIGVVEDFIHINIEANNIKIDSTFLITRFILNIVMFLPAWYCASIANKQRNREFQLRDFEIKTAGLEPFMENMKMVKCNDCSANTDANSNIKDTTKLELVKEIFTKDLDKKKVDDGNIIIPKEIITTIQSCLETWNKIKKN